MLPNLKEIKRAYWELGDLRYKLDPLQRKIRATVSQTDSKKILILSSRQIGKTFFSVVYALEFLIKNPGKIVRVVAPTLKQCNDIVQDNLIPICRDAPPNLIIPKKSAYRWDLSNGSSLRLGALERAHVDGNRGGNASLVIYEEAGFVSGDDFIYGVNSVLGPQLLRSNGKEIFVTSPSEEPDHPIHTQILPECKGLGTAFRFTVYDSPSISSAQIEEAARRCGGTNTEAFKREYLAEIIRPNSLMVVPDFNELKHVIDTPLPVRSKWTVTTDWGGVRDLTVSLLHTYDYLSDIHYIWREKHWPANTPTNIIIRDLKEWEAEYDISARWADVPGQTQVDILNVHDYQIMLPPKSDWTASVNQMAVMFTTDKVVINPACKFLIESLGAGMFNKTRTDFERTQRLGHMDALACLMYAFRTQDKENPFAVDGAHYHNVFIPEVKNETEFDDLSKAVNPRTFGKFRG